MLSSSHPNDIFSQRNSHGVTPSDRLDTAASSISTMKTPMGSQDHPVSIQAAKPVSTKGSDTWARPVEASWWNDQLVLILDGGGLRAYASLIILEELMERISHREQNQEIPAQSSEDSPIFPSMARPGSKSTTSRDSFRPCHYFDYIGGAGMGGLIAVMLGRLRWTVAETKTGFEHIIRNMQPQVSRFHLTRIMTKTNSKKRLKAAIWKTLATSGLQDVPKSKEPSPDDRQCKVAVLTMPTDRVEGSSRPVLMRSSQSKRDSVHSDDSHDSQSVGDNKDLIEACLEPATSPSSSPPLPLRFRSRRKSSPKDRESNSEDRDVTTRMYNAIGSDIQNPVRCLIRVGYDSTQSSNAGKTNKLDEILHSQQKIFYKRLNCPDPLAESHMEDWEIGSNVEVKMQRISTRSREYIASSRDELRVIARKLVGYRRERCETPGWEIYASGIAYRCHLCKKAGIHADELHHDAMVNHVLSAHKQKSSKTGFVRTYKDWDDLEEIVASSRTRSW